MKVDFFLCFFINDLEYLDLDTRCVEHTHVRHRRKKRLSLRSIHPIGLIFKMVKTVSMIYSVEFPSNLMMHSNHLNLQIYAAIYFNERIVYSMMYDVCAYIYVLISNQTIYSLKRDNEYETEKNATTHLCFYLEKHKK